jgi:hypothetical protein
MQNLAEIVEPIARGVAHRFLGEAIYYRGIDEGVGEYGSLT